MVAFKRNFRWFSTTQQLTGRNNSNIWKINRAEYELSRDNLTRKLKNNIITTLGSGGAVYKDKQYDVEDVKEAGGVEEAGEVEEVEEAEEAGEVEKVEEDVEKVD